MAKFLKRLLIEITLFIAMAALAGHVTVNIWERYVVQDKLSEMKGSLDHLKLNFGDPKAENIFMSCKRNYEIVSSAPWHAGKVISFLRPPKFSSQVTVHNIGYAYDDLQRDLMELARIDSKSSISREHIHEPIPCKRRRGLDDKVLEHLNLLFANVAQENDKARHVLFADKNIGSAHIVSNMALVKNATTATRYPMKATAVGPEYVTESKKRHDNECMHKCRARNNIRQCYEDCESANIFPKY